MSSNKPYIPTEQGGIRFISERKPGEVRIPNYVFDLWMPLLGAEVIGIYAGYTRLERESTVKSITLADLAKAYRVGKKSLMDINEKLEKCGFIRINKPTGNNRLKHYTTEITVLDAPTEITAETIAQYAHPQGYEPLSSWLVSEPPEVLSRTPDSSKENHDMVLNRTPKVESLSLQPSDLQPLEERKLSAPADSDPFKTFIEGLPIDEADPKPVRPRDPIFDAITTTWKISAGGMVGQIKAMMLGKAKKGEWATCNFEPAATAEEIMDFGRWYKVEADGLSLPTAPMKIQKWFYQYRESRPKFRTVIMPAEPLHTPLSPDDTGDDEPVSNEDIYALVSVLANNFAPPYGGQ